MRNPLIGARLFAVVCGFLTLSACAVEGILPKTELPPPPAVQEPYPTFAPRDDGEGVLTPSEREEIEARLTRLAKEREAGVTRRINQTK